jgi:membrane protease YdiL (CAAX protease family)
LPAIGVVAVAVVVVIGGFGEEVGWRGFALPFLQRRFDALVSALLLTPIWALWHLPFFFTVATYRDFPPAEYVGFVFGLACGSIILTWLYNGTSGSILACAIWHGVYNLETATVAASGMIAAVTTTLVVVKQSCSSRSRYARVSADSRRCSAPDAARLANTLMHG